MVLTYWVNERTAIDLVQLVEKHSAEMETPTARDQGQLSRRLWDFQCHNGFPRAGCCQTWYTCKDHNPHFHSPLHGLDPLAAAEVVEHLLACRKIDEWFWGETVKAMAAESHEERRQELDREKGDQSGVKMQSPSSNHARDLTLLREI